PHGEGGAGAAGVLGDHRSTLMARERPRTHEGPDAEASGPSMRTLYQRTTTARTSRADRTRNSSAPNFTSVPPYLLYRTRSPTAKSSGTRLPLSSMRPGPTATTSPSWGFSFSVSGMTRPLAVGCSASTCLMTMRSSSGLMDTDTSYLILSRAFLVALFVAGKFVG